jgi:hypothetical protein
MKKISLIPIHLLTTILILSIGCTKPELQVPESIPDKEFFIATENTVKNGDIIKFNLASAGVYTLTMTEASQNQVVSRERFTGKVGLNSLKIYTNSLSTKYLNVELKDQNNNQVGKTKIIIN